MCLENGQCINETKVCDFKVDCPIAGASDETECGTCTFGNDNGTLCGWKDKSPASVEWELVSGDITLGPSSDHTTGNGFYIAVKSSTSFEYASLQSPILGPTSTMCQLKFWYYMNYDSNTYVSQITVYIGEEIDNYESLILLGSFTDSTELQWKQISINIGSRRDRFIIGMLRFLWNIKDVLIFVYFRNRWYTECK